MAIGGWCAVAAPSFLPHILHTQSHARHRAMQPPCPADAAGRTVGSGRTWDRVVPHMSSGGASRLRFRPPPGGNGRGRVWDASEARPSLQIQFSSVGLVPDVPAAVSPTERMDARGSARSGAARRSWDLFSPPSAPAAALAERIFPGPVTMYRGSRGWRGRGEGEMREGGEEQGYNSLFSPRFRRVVVLKDGLCTTPWNTFHNSSCQHPSSNALSTFRATSTSNIHQLLMPKSRELLESCQPKGARQLESNLHYPISNPHP
eukprot:gene12795-biopygen7966